jgi:hypothetical protein
MSKKSDLIKNLVKTNVADKSTFGTNPHEPWSARAGLNETPLLNRYLKSRGINPEFATKDQKVAHSKTMQFKKWMNDHINDPVVESITTEPSPTRKRLAVLKQSVRKQREMRVPDGEKKLHSEAVDKKDTITFDIPLLIRVLEFAREDLKSDVNLHKMVERLISMRGKGTLTMNQYGKIIKEEVESERLDEISAELQHRYFKAAYAQKNDKTVPKDVRKKRNTGMNKVINRTLRRNTISTPGAAQDFKDQEAKRGIGHVRDHVEVEGDLTEAQSMMNALKNSLSKPEPGSKLDKKIKHHNSLIRAGGSGNWDKPHPPEGHHFDKKGMIRLGEAKEANYGGDYQSTVMRVKALAKKKPVDMASLAARMQASYKKDDEKKVKESLEPMAACSCASDGANTPDDTVPSKKSTAKKVKLLLGGKKGQVQEELYDHEKEDKSVAGLKKPKVQKQDADDTTKEAPDAAAILKGGKTLTGEPRDTIEIDPMMKMRKSSDASPEQNRPKKSY